MTILSANFVINEPFKKSLNSTTCNGIKSPAVNNQHKKETKIEFVEGGVLQPLLLSSSVIKLTPKQPHRFIGPVLPPGYVLPKTVEIKTPTTPIGTPKTLKRKRVVSERCEREAQYPVLDTTVAELNSWEGCKLNGRSSLAGIRNPHNNCFLNAVLQCVTHIPQFARYIYEHHQPGGKSCIGNWCLLCGLKRHMTNGLNRNVNEATWINPHFEDLFPTHSRGSQEDAHEMLLFLLDGIDRQQQRIRRSQPGKFSSIVEQVFDGKVRSEYICVSCQNKSICYEPIRGLSVELPRQDTPLEMARILHNYFQDERINGYDCKNCKRKTIATKRMRIVTAPRVLIIQLKRFLKFSKISTSVIPTKNINLTNVMHDHQNASYQLFGFIKHVGGSMSSGHYIATCQGFSSNNWYQFDDDLTRQVSCPVGNKNYQPYILFYSRDTSNTSTPPKSSPLSTPAKKPNMNNGISSSTSTSSFTVTKKNGQFPERMPPNYLLNVLNKK